MDELICSEFKLGRRLLGRLPHGKDLITSIENFYTASNILTATFSVTGVVSSATIGIFSETIFFAGEIDLQEMIGKPLERFYDIKTELMLRSLEGQGGS